MAKLDVYNPRPMVITNNNTLEKKGLSKKMVLPNNSRLSNVSKSAIQSPIRQSRENAGDQNK